MGLLRKTGGGAGFEQGVEGGVEVCQMETVQHRQRPQARAVGKQAGAEEGDEEGAAVELEWVRRGCRGRMRMLCAGLWTPLCGPQGAPEDFSAEE